MNREELRSLLNEELAPLFGGLTKQMQDLENKLETKVDKKDLDRIYDTLDAILKNQETEQQERAATNGQNERKFAHHEHLIQQTAEHVGLELDFGEAA